MTQVGLRGRESNNKTESLNSYQKKIDPTPAVVIKEKHKSEEISKNRLLFVVTLFQVSGGAHTFNT